MRHYHIEVVCEWLHYPQVVTTYESRSIKLFNELVLFMYDMHRRPEHSSRRYNVSEGSNSIILWESHRAMFGSGTRVLRHICFNDCIEKFDAAQQGETPDLRDTFYEG